MMFAATEGHFFADAHGKMWRCPQPEGHDGRCALPAPVVGPDEEALATARAEGARDALRAAAHHFGVIWGSGVTTEAQVGKVLAHWAEYGVGTRLDIEASRV